MKPKTREDFIRKFESLADEAAKVGIQTTTLVFESDQALECHAHIKLNAPAHLITQAASICMEMLPEGHYNLTNSNIFRSKAQKPCGCEDS